MCEPTIRLRRVNKTFGTTRAVRELDLDVPRGSLCGFLGPNGAGKTTAIRMIMSIIYPDSGTVDVLGGSALHSKDRIGYLPEERGVYRKMRVGEFLEYIARLKGFTRPDLSAHVGQWLERLELPGVYRRKCEELSKGMQQKVQFLAAVLHEPDLLILDEPFSGLDPVNTELLSGLIREMHAQGRTIIFSTHVLHQAEQLCDRIFLINHGIKVLDATFDEIRERFDPRTILVEPLDGRGDASQVGGVRGIRSARRLPGTGALELELEDNADHQAVMAAVVGRLSVRRVELRRLTLDEVFVRVVQRDAGAAAAEQVREELARV